jgi:Pvc16 N-terminal domain
MSDYRVIAAATLTLQNLLLDAIRDSAPGATVKTGPPEVRPPEEVGEGLINIFLYKVEPNRVWRNEDLPYRRGDGSLMRRPQVAVDVHYLLSFYGDERRKIPYLLMGLAMSALHAEPYPSIKHMPQETNGANGDDFGEDDPVSAGLAGSGLEQQTHPLSFTFMPVSHDELVPLFSQIPFVMSVAYRGSVLLIEPLVTPVPPLPVRRADFYVTNVRRPVLASISPQLLPYTRDAQIELRGEALAAPAVRVLFGTLEAAPAVQPDGSLRSALPDGLQAGMHLVRVAHATGEADGGMPARWAIESNPVALVVEPAVVEASQVALPAAGPSNGGHVVGLQVRFAPSVTARTPVLVLLNEVSRNPERAPRAYALQIDAEPASADLVALRAEVEPGSYLVRVQMHGVTSRLEIDDDRSSPTFERYASPRIVIV